MLGALQSYYVSCYISANIYNISKMTIFQFSVSKISAAPMAPTLMYGIVPTSKTTQTKPENFQSIGVLMQVVN